MNEKAVFEIGELIQVKCCGIPMINLRELTAKEIIETDEFKAFETKYPALVKAVGLK